MPVEEPDKLILGFVNLLVGEKDAHEVYLDLMDIVRGEGYIRSYDLFEEIICPMCYRLNPQHATMDNGKGCHWCQDRLDWGGVKGFRGDKG